MSGDRDELARLLSPYDQATANSRVSADAVWAAGWRKKPSREDLVSLTAELFVGNVGPLMMADAILALMDGPTETGEK